MTPYAATLIRWHAAHIRAAKRGTTPHAVALARAARARIALAIELRRARNA
jgi:hypothetical protein